MTKSMSIIQADFDQIALLSKDGWDHNSHYHGFLLKQIPTACLNALEIGCGTGDFSRLLARHSEQLLALDLSPNMVQIAKERSHSYPNIEFQVADVLEWQFPKNRFDCIVSIATLHHLPLEEILLKMREALRVNGLLIILDLFQEQGVADFLTALLALPIDAVLRLIKNGRLKAPPEVQEAWAKHGQNDSYLTFSQIRQTCDALLPGAKVRKHLLWRYSIVWQKSETR